MPRLRNKTLTLTEKQIDWLKSERETSGLNQNEIVRRALDAYIQEQQGKQQTLLFSFEQRIQIRRLARQNGVTERDIIQAALKDFFK